MKKIKNIFMIVLALFVAMSMGPFYTANMVFAMEDAVDPELSEISEDALTENSYTDEVIETDEADEKGLEDSSAEAKTLNESDADAGNESDEPSESESFNEEILQETEGEDIIEEPEQEQAEAVSENEELAKDAEEAEEDEDMIEPDEDTGDFIVAASKGAEYDFNDGVLTINSGKVTVSTESETNQRIVISGSATLVIKGIDIKAKDGAAIKANAGVKATITIAEGSENNVSGGAKYAGIESGYEDGNLATLRINGSGKLNAVGGSDSAGIGGSSNNKTSDGKSISSYSGNIIIDGGSIKATGTGGGAGIGSAGNNGRNGDGSSQSPSYKMKSSGIGSITINGGSIEAIGGSAGAGIGGGNHCDSGEIVINGGNIKAKASNGAGIGSGQGSSNYGGDANKGHGYFYADITINGGVIEEAIGGWLGAGIGGGYECDAIITINGGTIKLAKGGNGNNGSYYQGAPGIGAGYQGNVIFNMSGGTIEYAEGGWSAPGIGYGAAVQDYGSKRKADGEKVSAENSLIKISGGTIKMAKGGKYAAGIGGGNGCVKCNITISGGNITAEGYSDENDKSAGGAGIGSGVGKASGLKYSSDTQLNISITGGTVKATGGWGASAIGSGAKNESAKGININGDKANIEAYADGTKFAIDTRDSKGSNVKVTGMLLQGTFVTPYTTDEGVSQNTSAVTELKVTNDNTGDVTTLSKPDGYRSFATTVSDEGSYTVYTDDDSVADGKGCYYNVCSSEEYDENNVTDWNVKYSIKSDELSDNYYLFPVKTVVVSKEVVADDDVMKNLNQTLNFALWEGGSDGHYITKDGEIWRETIEIVSGEPQGNAYFTNVSDGEYAIWEQDEDGNDMQVGTELEGSEGIVLSDISTKHGDNTDNDAVIGDLWVEEITVVNTYTEKSGEKEDTESAEPYDDNDQPVNEPETELDIMNDETPENVADNQNPDESRDSAEYDERTEQDDRASDDELNKRPFSEGLTAMNTTVNDPVNPANPATGAVGNKPANNAAGVASAGTNGNEAEIVQVDNVNADESTTSIADNSVPLGDSEGLIHKDNILRFLAALATLLMLVVYTKRRKSIKEDIYQLEEELVKYEEV